MKNIAIPPPQPLELTISMQSKMQEAKVISHVLHSLGIKTLSQMFSLRVVFKTSHTKPIDKGHGQNLNSSSKVKILPVETGIYMLLIRAIQVKAMRIETITTF